MNLNQFPILDQHCHSFQRRAAPWSAGEWLGFFSEGGDARILAEHTANSVFVRWGLKELARFFDCAPTLEAVLSARNAEPHDALCQRMLADANIRTVLIDYGLAGEGRLSIAEMQACLPAVRVEPVLRLEVLAQDLIGQHAKFETWREAFRARVTQARAHGDIGLKSIIAYRTGLAIAPEPHLDEVRAAFGRAQATHARAGQVRLADKALNDFVVVEALEIAAQESLPIQLHTGLGDSDLDMWLANPLHLRPLFESGRYRAVPFVLLHASYPYVRELGYLASIYHNVWFDIGLAVPFATLDIPAVWRQALALTPFSKILFSTDAYSIPEIYWLAARWGRWGLSIVLEELLASGAFSAGDVDEAAEAILQGNAAGLYAVA